jgi:hypothetical protein
MWVDDWITPPLLRQRTCVLKSLFLCVGQIAKAGYPQKRIDAKPRALSLCMRVRIAAV